MGFFLLVPANGQESEDNPGQEQQEQKKEVRRPMAHVIAIIAGTQGTLCPHAHLRTECEQKFSILIDEARGLGMSLSIRVERAKENKTEEKAQLLWNEDVADLKRRFEVLVNRYEILDI